MEKSFADPDPICGQIIQFYKGLLCSTALQTDFPNDTSKTGSIILLMVTPPPVHSENCGELAKEMKHFYTIRGRANAVKQSYIAYCYCLKRRIMKRCLCHISFNCFRCFQPPSERC